MKLRFIIVLFLISAFTTSATSASLFSDIYVFGDSLSDQGNFFAATQSVPTGPTPPLEYTDGTNFGRFTNGLNYIDYLSADLGLLSLPSLTGGKNFAFGGARISSNPYGGLSLLDQLNTFSDASSGMADPNALYVVWAGANDLADYLKSSETTISPVKSLFYLISVIETLAVSGAETILVPNIPDIGLTPMIMEEGASQAATSLTAGFNEGLEVGLSLLELIYTDVNFIRFDTFGVLNEIFADPASVGFTNVMEACYSEFVMPDGTIRGNPDEYLSWDGFHPTTAVHQILADQIARVAVPVPASMLLFGFGLLSMAGIGRRKKQV